MEAPQQMTDPAVFKSFPLTEEMTSKILKSFTPDQIKLFENMRTEHYLLRNGQDSDSESFKKIWNQTAGSILVLTTLIGD